MAAPATASALVDVPAGRGRSAGGVVPMRKFSEGWWAERGDERRCTARTKAGRRCTHPAIKGGTVCFAPHGGKAPQVQAAAARRLARETALQFAAREAEAQPWLAELGSDPLAHIEALLRFEALSYATWKLACEQLVESGDLLLWQNHKGEAAIHPYMEEMDKAAVRWDRVSKHAIDAGVSTKRLAMEEESMGLLAAAARMALAEKALGLAPEVQREALRFLGQHLRSIGPGTGP